jgi:hypothetical protein
MKKIIKIIKIILILYFCLVLVGGLGVLIGSKIYEIHLTRPILHADHQAILAACRTMIAERQNYHNQRPDSKNRPGDPVWPSKDEFPTVIKNLDPRYIIVDKDHVVICFSALPRVYLYGFAEGAEQYGTRKLIDGLWIGSSI